MRLKKVFAGALAAAMLVCAVAVPAFAAEEVEQENCLTSSYVQMNIPYADFYKAAGVDNASEIDAVTSATKNKTRAGNLAAGSYHVNADGSDITGVSFPVKVLTPWALKNAKQVTDADSYDITVTLRARNPPPPTPAQMPCLRTRATLTTSSVRPLHTTSPHGITC